MQSGILGLREAGSCWREPVGGENVILNAAKDLAACQDLRNVTEILRCAQDDIFPDFAVLPASLAAPFTPSGVF